MDPTTIKDENGKEVLYAPLRYKQLVFECYKISHQIHTSYTDVLNMSVRERNYLLEFIDQELEQNKENLKKLQQQSKTKK